VRTLYIFFFYYISFLYLGFVTIIFTYVHTQLLLGGPGLELGSQLTSKEGLVFPTKGSSSPSDPTTPLSSCEHPYFPLYVTLPLGVTSSLSLSLSLFSLQNCQPPFYTHFLYL